MQGKRLAGHEAGFGGEGRLLAAARTSCLLLWGVTKVNQHFAGSAQLLLSAQTHKQQPNSLTGLKYDDIQRGCHED